MNDIVIGVTACFGNVGSEVVKILQEKNYSVLGYSAQNKVADFAICDSMSKFIEKSDLIIDFSHPDVMKDLLTNLVNNPKPLVSGTTGHDCFDLLKQVSLNAPILWSANMSLGINVMLRFIEQYIEALEDFDISIIEMHRKNKIDSPSGTAIQLKDEIHKKTPEKNIQIASIRSGDIFGSHSLMFANQDEIIEIKHEALNRKLFAIGAIKAAEFLLNKRVGLYSMKDIF